MPTTPQPSQGTIISTTTYTFVVAHRTDSPPESLHDALNEAMGGHAVGNESSRPVTVAVPDRSVPALLRTLGNDGSFFDDDLSGEA